MIDLADADGQNLGIEAGDTLTISYVQDGSTTTTSGIIISNFSDFLTTTLLGTS